MREEIQDRLTKIADGSLIFVSNEGIASKLIEFYAKLEDWKLFLEKNTFIPNHIQFYVGTTSKGRNMCWSAEASGFKQVWLTDRFTKDTTIVVAQYMPLTVNQFELMKAFCWGASGKPYDFGGIANFGFRVFNWIPFVKRVFHNKVSEWDWALFCSESAVDIYETAGIKVSNKKASDTTPAHILKYISREWYRNIEGGITIGSWNFWKLWDGSKKGER